MGDVRNKQSYKDQTVIPAAQWNYVKSEQNPADCATRGLLPSKLMSFSLWWHGPEFLTKQDLSGDTPCSFQTNFGCINHVQVKKPSTVENNNIITNLLNKYSSLTRVIRIMAWISRFITNLRNRTKSETAYLTTIELSAARKSIIMHTQRVEFNSEYKQLVNNETISKKSAILKLNPYINKTGIICVGGRLKHSSLPGEMKNPVIIPHRGRLTQLLIEEAHSATLHGGARLTLAYIRQRYWIVGGNRAVKNQLRKCVRCHRFNKTDGYQLMGDLPQQRITPCRPFTHTGIDFTGMLSLFTFVTGSLSATDGTRGAPASNTQITSLERERPIYYDTVGKMQVVHDEWILMMYYNLTNYWEGTYRTQTYFDNIKSLCHKTNLQHCRSTMEQLSHEMELLNYYNSILINPHKHLSNRKKRGLIDGVGYVANSLFGILDQQFAKKYQNDIKSLQTNENYLLELIKNQTTIVELENQVLKRSEENIQRQFNFIDNFINQTNTNLASIETEMEVLSATTYINSASLTTYLLISSLRTFQEMLFNTLTNVYQGHVDVHLINPVRLMQKLTEISGNLPKTLSLPVENYKENIKDMYKLINVKARVTENYFLFEAHIPLVANEDFDIYKGIPLPVKIAKETTYVQLSNKYIAVNFKKNVYMSMSEDDLKHCTQQKSQNLLSPTINKSVNKIVNLTYHYAPNTLQSKDTDQEIEAIEKKIVSQSHDIHQYAVCYSLLTAAIIVALVVVGRNRCRNRCTRHPNNKTASQPPEEIELQIIKKPVNQEETGAAQTTKDLRVEPRSGSRNIAFQFD
ncbi:hypothetical protein HF086_016414 [Spodoptera exigua]|uniref:Integrase zinc-binding domain-containing protein n=1 Tax=Spodoptera exigua TaxID=7107 RepID=A0A922MXW6_SPOEX|nr:hypothetical protein HF086_016414 [Spodoptera exigua]